MRKNRVRGYNKRFYPGVAFIVAAILCLVFALTRLNIPLLEMQNKYFNLYDAEKNEVYILKVNGIDKNSVKNSDFGKWALYLVSYLEKDKYGNESTELIGLELDEETAKQLIDKKNTLRDNPEKIAGTFVKPDINDKKVMYYSLRTQAAMKKYIKFPISRRHQNYVSIKPGKDTQKLFLIISLVLFIPGLALLYLAHRHQKFAEAYNNLFAGYPDTEEIVAAYPELRGKRVITLAKNATYADKETNVFIYKDFFFTTATGLAIYRLTKAKSVYHYQQTLYPENGSPYNKSFLVFETNDPDTPVRTRRIEIYNIGEDTDAHLQTFFDTLRKEFPHIEIGKTKENKK